MLLCAAAFCGFYYWGTASHRDLLQGQTPELAWLKREFNLSDAEFARITKQVRVTTTSRGCGSEEGAALLLLPALGGLLLSRRRQFLS